MLMAQSFRFLGENHRVKFIIDSLIENVTNRAGWAEGISPLTKLGSVGDSPNGYAAAEFVNLILDLFAEDDVKKSPTLLKGMPIEWLEKGVSAKGLKLFYNSSLDISAKLENNVLSVEWNYDNPSNNLKPILHLPSSPKSIPSGVIQLSTRELQLSENKGHISIKL